MKTNPHPSTPSWFCDLFHQLVKQAMCWNRVGKARLGEHGCGQHECWLIHPRTRNGGNKALAVLMKTESLFLWHICATSWASFIIRHSPSEAYWVTYLIHIKFNSHENRKLAHTGMWQCKLTSVEAGFSGRKWRKDSKSQEGKNYFPLSNSRVLDRLRIALGESISLPHTWPIHWGYSWEESALHAATRAFR